MPSQSCLITPVMAPTQAPISSFVSMEEIATSRKSTQPKSLYGIRHIIPHAKTTLEKQMTAVKPLGFRARETEISPTHQTYLIISGRCALKSYQRARERSWHLMDAPKSIRTARSKINYRSGQSEAFCHLRNPYGSDLLKFHSMAKQLRMRRPDRKIGWLCFIFPQIVQP